MSVGYFCAIFVAVIFMLYMDGAVGVLMLAFLLLMPVLSLLITLWVKRSVTVALELPDTAAKSETLTAYLHLKKQTRLPLPFLRLHFTADAHFLPLNPLAEPLPEAPQESGNPIADALARRRWRRMMRVQLTPETLPMCLSMGAEEERRYEIALTARYCGSGTVSVSEIRLSDYLAMFSFRLHTECAGRILVTPEIPETKANSELFRSVSTAVAAADEETEMTPTASASAVPGYEHRDYIAGDSLKRINWKLSTKRRKLMVRQDEPVSLARLSVVLDLRRGSERMPDALRLANEELLIETALGFLMLCARSGYPCTLYYLDTTPVYDSGSAQPKEAACEWQAVSIDDGGQLAAEAIPLLRGGFCAEGYIHAQALPAQLSQESGAVLLYFTTNGASPTAAVLPSLGTEQHTIVPEGMAASVKAPAEGGFWTVSADHTLREIKS
ncbi:MAG: DUF58 domain-containing protein [Oscillospiraceae bacterium]|nr:DUF58 domain-containing protein [Oscillospiraceae bacterium]